MLVRMSRRILAARLHVGADSSPPHRFSLKPSLIVRDKPLKEQICFIKIAKIMAVLSTVNLILCPLKNFLSVPLDIRISNSVTVAAIQHH